MFGIGPVELLFIFVILGIFVWVFNRLTKRPG